MKDSRLISTVIGSAGSRGQRGFGARLGGYVRVSTRLLTKCRDPGWVGGGASVADDELHVFEVSDVVERVPVDREEVGAQPGVEPAGVNQAARAGGQ